MASISAEEAASELLACCLQSRPWPESLLDPLLNEESSHLLFRVVAEGLADRFEPRLCDAYSQLFATVIARSLPEMSAREMEDRYRRVRAPRRFEGDPARVRNVFVLSRVTLGADIAITSVLLDAARRKFPAARILFVGARKAWELFAGSPDIEHAPVLYGRTGSLSARLALFPELCRILRQPDSIVIDPDSRLTQLGLLPVCPEDDYFFFESRAFGGDAPDPLGALAARWAAETFGIGHCRAFLKPAADGVPHSDITVSLGVGENPAKRVGGPFEENLLRLLAQRGTVLVDKGAGGEEAQRVERAMRLAGGNVSAWDGSFAGFAARIAQSSLYVGYDSAGGHAAAASGVPVVSIFAGFPTERMFQRWRPAGQGAVTVIRASTDNPDAAWSATLQALSKMNP